MAEAEAKQAQETAQQESAADEQDSSLLDGVDETDEQEPQDEGDGTPYGRKKKDEEDAGDEPGDDDGSEGEEPDAGSEKADAPVENPLDLKLPDDMPVDEGLLAHVSQVAKDEGVSKEAVQKLVDGYADALRARATNDAEQYKAYVNDLKQEVMKDPDIGGDNWPAAKKRALQAAAALGGQPLLDLLASSWVGSDIRIVKALERAGRALVKEDTFLGAEAGAASGAQMSEDAKLASLYPKTSPKE